MAMSSMAVRRMALLGGVAVAIIVALWCVFGGSRYIGTENAYIKADKISIASEVTGVVKAVSVRANQFVHQGDVLVQLDDEPYQIAVSEAKANLAQIHNEVLSMRADYAETNAQLQQARTDAKYYSRELERDQKLDQVAVSASQLDAARQALAKANAQIAVYNSQLESLRAELGGGPDVPVEQQPDYQAASARLAKATYELSRTTVRAPSAGMIANDVPLSGEMAAAGVPLISVIRTDNTWVEANLKETELATVKLGQTVDVSVDAYPGEHWQAVVDSMSPASGSEFALIPPQNASGNWVKVVQRIPVRLRLIPRNDAPVLRAGMSVQVEIDTESNAARTAEL